jgi:hypothetical protein
METAVSHGKNLEWLLAWEMPPVLRLGKGVLGLAARQQVEK